VSWARAGVALAFIADIALKVWVRSTPANAGRFAFWPSVGPIGIVPSVNDVLAFSLPIANWYIWPIGWIVVAVLIRAFVSSRKQFQLHRRSAIGAIILGAISNLMDRTFLGGVTDYLSFTNLFPAFNIADLLIIGGIVMLVWRDRRLSMASGS